LAEAAIIGEQQFSFAPAVIFFKVGLVTQVSYASLSPSRLSREE
jgi:hypothetical protein